MASDPHPITLHPRARARRLRALVVAGPAAIIAVFALVILLVGRQVLASRAWVAHTRDVIDAAERTLSDAQDAETGQRGYLLTGDTAYLEPYHRARHALATDTTRLRQLTRDNATQQRRLDLLGAVLAAKVAELDSTIAMATAGRDTEAVRHVRSGVGKQRMDSVRFHLARLQAEEQRLLARRQDDEAAAVRRTTAIVLLGALVAAALAWTTSRLLAQQARALAGSNAQLEQKASALESSERDVRRLAAGLEREVDARTRELRAVNRELEAFTYTVSHDLRAPLRALQGFALALDEDYGARLDATGREYTAFIGNAARQMDQLIQDLLAFSRLGRTEVQLAPLDLRAAVGDARAQVAADLEGAGATVVVDPSLEREATVCGDRRLTTQAIANLLTNAAKFVAPGTRPRIVLSVESLPGRTRLVVEDNGIGIAPEHRERVFQVFERLHSAEEYPGTGIGLAIVRRAAERMGGTAGLEGAPSGGSRVWMEWPATFTSGVAGSADATQRQPCTSGPGSLTMQDDDRLRRSLGDA